MIPRSDIKKQEKIGSIDFISQFISGFSDKNSRGPGGSRHDVHPVQAEVGHHDGGGGAQHGGLHANHRSTF